MNLFPPSAIAGALAVGITLPFFHLCLAHARPTRWGPGSVFRITVASSILALLLICTITPPHAWLDLIAASFALIAALIAWFIIFSLLAWGFTLTMLTTIAAARTTLSLRSWMVAYGGGDSPEALTQNRLAILLSTGLIKKSPDGFTVTAPGRIAAAIVRMARYCLGSA